MNKILDVNKLNVTFKSRGKDVKVVRGIDIEIDNGEIVGIVGESGSGKSVTMKSILGILPENAEVNAEKMIFNGKNLLSISEEEYRDLRGKEMTMIFQDPMTALNPLMKIGKQLEEVIIRHRTKDKKEAAKLAVEMLGRVGISNPEHRMNQYPHEFSGGMRQRVMIAMALLCEPNLLIADEPTTALDVTIQAQILDLLGELKSEIDTSIVLITHDMGVVATVCSRIMIMYGGMIMETGTTDEIFYKCRHPYTKALLEAIPSVSMREGEKLKSIPGLPPSLVDLPKGCPFADRCEKAMAICSEKIPEFKQHSETHKSMCHLNFI